MGINSHSDVVDQLLAKDRLNQKEADQLRQEYAELDAPISRFAGDNSGPWGSKDEFCTTMYIRENPEVMSSISPQRIRVLLDGRNDQYMAYYDKLEVMSDAVKESPEFRQRVLESIDSLDSNKYADVENAATLLKVSGAYHGDIVGVVTPELQRAIDRYVDPNFQVSLSEDFKNTGASDYALNEVGQKSEPNGVGSILTATRT